MPSKGRTLCSRLLCRIRLGPMSRFSGMVSEVGALKSVLYLKISLS